jgi:hypothetical protein
MSIHSRISNNEPHRGMRSAPPQPPSWVTSRPTGPAPELKQTSQADKDKHAVQMKIWGERMTADQMHTNSAYRSADSHYRKADEMESRLKQGAPQLDEKTMNTIRPSQHLRDRPKY